VRDHDRGTDSALTRPDAAFPGQDEGKVTEAEESWLYHMRRAREELMSAYYATKQRAVAAHMTLSRMHTARADEVSTSDEAPTTLLMPGGVSRPPASQDGSASST
jgi:hypothetical protein